MAIRTDKGSSRDGRLLGFFEELCATEHESTGGRCTVAGVCLVDGVVEGTAVVAASRILWARHPLLRMSIRWDEESRRHRFREITAEIGPPCDLKEGTIYSGWEEVERLLHIPMPQDGHLWRVTVVSDRQSGSQRALLIVMAHHAVCDGLSMCRILGEMLALIDPPIAPGPEHDGRRGDLMMPPVEELLGTRRDWSTYLQARERLAKRQPEGRVTMHNRQAPISDRSHRNRYYHLTPSKTNSLLSACRMHEVSIMGALCASLVLSVESSSSGSGGTPLVVPVSLRGRCEPPLAADRIGCYVSCVDLVVDGKERQFWELARDCMRRLDESIKVSSITPATFTVSELSCMPGAVESPGRTAFENGYCISNVGRVETPPRGDNLKICGMWFASNRHTGDMPLLLSVCTVEGAMSLCFSHTEPLLCAATAESIAAETMLRLLNVSASWRG